jgi:hypothetical protein
MPLRVANFPFLSAINLKVKILLQRPYFESEFLILIVALAQKASDFSNINFFRSNKNGKYICEA